MQIKNNEHRGAMTSVCVIGLLLLFIPLIKYHALFLMLYFVVSYWGLSNVQIAEQKGYFIGTFVGVVSGLWCYGIISIIAAILRPFFL